VKTLILLFIWICFSILNYLIITKLNKDKDNWEIDLFTLIVSIALAPITFIMLILHAADSTTIIKENGKTKIKYNP